MTDPTPYDPTTNQPDPDALVQPPSATRPDPPLPPYVPEEI